MAEKTEKTKKILPDDIRENTPKYVFPWKLPF